MKRTRKWAFVAQEARRLAGLGLAPIDIAKRINVKRSTVQRWMASGKLTDTRRGTRSEAAAAVGVTKLTKPSEWAAAVRRDYQLDATDDQLVTLAESALGASFDTLQSMSTRLSSMGRFQALVKQLSLVARAADQPDVPPAKTESPVPARAPRRSRGPAVDPREILRAVK